MNAARIGGGTRSNFSAPQFNSGSRGNYSAPKINTGTRSNFSAPQFSGGSRGNPATAQFKGGTGFTTSKNFSGSNRTPGSFTSPGTAFRNPGSMQAGNPAFKGSDRGKFNPAVNPGHYAAGKLNHPVNPQTWHHQSNRWHSGADWNRGHPWYGYHHYYPNSWYPLASAALWSPLWWSIGTNYGWNSYPYCEYYYGSDYGYRPTTYLSTAAVPVESYTANYEQTPPPSAEPAEQPAASEETDWGMQYLGGAYDAFRQGAYADALRLANHAAIEMPKSAKPHEVMSLAAFALKDYRGANLEAHAALSLGAAADWPALYGYYGDLPTYTKQLNALVDYVREHKDAADARFVLAYHNLMMGHADAAKSQFEKVLAKVPQDQLAAELLKKLGGKPPDAPPPTPPAPGITAPGIENPPPSAEEKPASGEPKSF